jgi:uncharacterized repeat protein (TIGR01451 family)
MKFKVTTMAVVLMLISASASFAAIRYVDDTGSDTYTLDPDGAGPLTIGDPNSCLISGDPCATIAHALSEADQGDTITLALGTYTEGAIDITKSYVTIQGPNAGAGFGGRSVFGAGPCDAAEACVVGTGAGYIFSIQANNVTIDGLDLVGDPTTTWAAIVIEGDYDRWTIDSNLIEQVGQKKAGLDSNHSYGIYGDAQTSNGTDAMEGNEIVDNLFTELGRQGLPGSNETAGMAIRLEGVSGEAASCNAIDKFDCGVWIHDNQFEDLAVGQNELNFSFDVNGKERSVGVYVVQDAENTLPNNGAVIESNEYNDDSVDSDLLDDGVIIGIGDSQVNEANAVMLADVVAYVTSIDGKATVDELALADFYKTLNSTFYGPGTDVYFEDETEAKNASDDAATIVHLEQTSAAPDLYRVSVEARGTSASYKVSLDNAGDLNVRQGARLLYDGAMSDLATDGVTEVVLDGTDGEDLLTVDFNNGNPVPPANPGIDFDGLDGFDRVVLRGDEQVTNQTIRMDGVDSGTIYFEPTAGAGLALDAFTPGTTTSVDFASLEPIDDLIIVNGAYAVIAPDDTNNEINVINGPFRFGFDTFQINSGQDATFEEINFANKKNVHIYGSEIDGGAQGDSDDVFTLFTEDGDAPDLLLNIFMYGSNDALDTGDDYFVVRPSMDFGVSVDGGGEFGDDYLFLDCANTDASCDQSVITAGLPSGTYSGLSGFGFEDIDFDDIEASADAIADDLTITKELVGFAQDGAHPGDDLEYRVTVTNNGGAGFTLNDFPIWVTDVIDHRLSLVEQSVVVTQGTVQVVGNNTAMLWMIDGAQTFENGDTVTMTYTVIVNTLITTEDVDNYATILNYDGMGDYADDFDVASLDVLDVFGFPVKAAIQASLFYETEAGPRYMVGLYAGAKDPAQGNLGSMLCRVPDTNQEVGWDGGLGNLWFTCGEGLPAKDGLFSPLVVTDLYQDSAGRIWLTTWGFDGLYYSDDGGQTWSSANADLSGGVGGAPDGIPDGFAQIYAITEDILGTLYISANNGDVYRSFDRAVTWQKAKQLPMGTADTAYSLEADPTVPGKLYAGTFGDSLYVTQDFAETWDRPDLDGLGNGYIFDIEIDPITGNIFVGTAKGIFYSADEGENWDGLNSAFPFPTNPPEIRNISFDVNGSLFASTWGQGVWASLDWQADALGEFALKTGNVMDISVSNGFVHVLTDTGATYRFAYEGRSSSVNTEDETVELPNGFALEQNYPNPFNPTTSIAFSLPQSAQVNLTVFDVLGRRVATLVNGNLAAGQHQVQFEASSLPSGMYLYRLTTPKGAMTQKMMLLK